jgi:hypothetical protein
MEIVDIFVLCYMKQFLSVDHITNHQDSVLIGSVLQDAYLPSPSVHPQRAAYLVLLKALIL